MGKSRTGLAVLLLAVQPFMTPALAQNPPPGDTTNPVLIVDEAKKEICKADKVTGTRLAKKKTCRTKAEWDEFYRLQREETEQMQRNSMNDKRLNPG